MKLCRRMLGYFLTIVLCLGILMPTQVFASDLCLTALNDSLLPLTTDTMPVWSNGSLYVPYTVFDRDSSGIDLGVYASYSRSENTVSLYNLHPAFPKILVFDLNSGTCRNTISQETVTGRAIMRNGRPYLPVSTVCPFFNLAYSYISIPSASQSYIVRIKNSNVVLSDSRFLDAAANLIDRRLKEYNQSLIPPPITPAPAPVLPEPAPDQTVNVPTYLSFSCTTGEGLPYILDTLDRYGRHAIFFLSPDFLRSHGALVFRMVGSGHTIGLLANGATWRETSQQLSQGRTLLAQLAFLHTTAVHIPNHQRADARKAGFVCWSDTVALSPSDSISPNSFAVNVLRKLSTNLHAAYVSLPANANTARVLPMLLQRLNEKHFAVFLPLETAI